MPLLRLEIGKRFVFFLLVLESKFSFYLEKQNFDFFDFFVSPFKMLKLSDLRNWAREEGISNFSRMSKQELMEEWENSQPEEPIKISWQPQKKKKIPMKLKTKNPLNWQNEKIKIPILRPTVVEIKKKELPKILTKQQENWDEWLESVKNVEDEWQKRRFDSALDKLKKKIVKIREQENEFKAEKDRAAFKEFVTQFTIQGKVGFSPTDFLKATKKVVVDLFEQNKQTKTKIVLVCLMSGIDLRSGEIVLQEAGFHSRVEKNLEVANREKTFERMSERILENLANFQRRGSIGDSTKFWI